MMPPPQKNLKTLDIIHGSVYNHGSLLNPEITTKCYQMLQRGTVKTSNRDSLTKTVFLSWRIHGIVLEKIVVTVTGLV